MNALSAALAAATFKSLENETELLSTLAFYTARSGGQEEHGLACEFAMVAGTQLLDRLKG